MGSAWSSLKLPDFVLQKGDAPKHFTRTPLVSSNVEISYNDTQHRLKVPLKSGGGWLCLTQMVKNIFQKREIFMEISYFGENLTKNMRFSRMCQIFTQFIYYLKVNHFSKYVHFCFEVSKEIWP